MRAAADASAELNSSVPAQWTQAAVRKVACNARSLSGSMFVIACNNESVPGGGLPSAVGAGFVSVATDVASAVEREVPQAC